MDTRPPSRLAQALGVEVPLLCGAMYPCSNPELVAAVSEAGGLGIVQPLSLVYVHGFEFRAAVRNGRIKTPDSFLGWLFRLVGGFFSKYFF